jgi:hypothetical protein
MAIACIAAVFLDSTLLHSRMEFAGVSLAWLTGGAAILLILLHELLDSVAGTPRKKKPRQFESEIRAAEFPAGEAPDRQAVSTSDTRGRVTAGTDR